jgi:hypothetical protein
MKLCERPWDRNDWVFVRKEFGGADGTCGLEGPGLREIFLESTTPRAAGKARSNSNWSLTMWVAPERKKIWAWEARKTTSARDRTSTVAGASSSGTFGSVAGWVPCVRKLLDRPFPLCSVARPGDREAALAGSSTGNQVNRACKTFSFSISKLKALRTRPPRDQTTW